MLPSNVTKLTLLQDYSCCVHQRYHHFTWMWSYHRHVCVREQTISRSLLLLYTTTWPPCVLSFKLFFHMTSSPPCWLTWTKRFLVPFSGYVPNMAFVIWIFKLIFMYRHHHYVGVRWQKMCRFSCYVHQHGRHVFVICIIQLVHIQIFTFWDFYLLHRPRDSFCDLLGIISTIFTTNAANLINFEAIVKRAVFIEASSFSCLIYDLLDDAWSQGFPT